MYYIGSNECSDVNSSPGTERDYLWRPPQWCSLEDARLCAESSCWSRDSPPRFRLSFSCRQNTPVEEIKIKFPDTSNVKYLIVHSLIFNYLAWFEHGLWFSNFSWCFQRYFLARVAVKHSEISVEVNLHHFNSKIFLLFTWKSCYNFQSWWQSPSHSTRTQTCQRCSRSRTRSRAWTVGTRARCTSRWAWSPCEGPTLWRTSSPWRSCTCQSWRISHLIYWRWFQRRRICWLDPRAPRTF